MTVSFLVSAPLMAENVSRIVLLSTGAFAPIHNGHIEMMEVAKKELESQGNKVVKAIFSPSNEQYTFGKGVEFRRYPFLTRLELCKKAISSVPWMSCSDWEGKQKDFIDFPEVIEHFNSIYAPKGIKVVYLFGSDHLSFATTLRARRLYGVCLTRVSTEIPNSIASSEYLTFIKTKNNYSEVSSTKIRDAYRKAVARNDSTIPKKILDIVPASIKNDLDQIYFSSGPKTLSLANKLDIYSDYRWFESILGRREADIKKRDFYQDEESQWWLRIGKKRYFAGKFYNPTYVDMEQEYNEKAQTLEPNEMGMRFKVEYGKDALELTLSNDSANSIIQVASQFNALESTGPFLSNVTNYFYDRTQGPRSVMPTASATLYRTLFLNDYNALKHTPFGKYVKHGYLIWGNSSEANRLNQVVDVTSYDRIELPFMISSPELSRHKVTHFFCASAPTGTYGNSSGTNESSIVYQLLKRQYLGIGMHASIEAHKKRKRQIVHLTMVGMGVFGNDQKIFIKVMDEFLSMFRKQPIDVVLHSYTESSTAQSVLDLYRQRQN